MKPKIEICRKCPLFVERVGHRICVQKQEWLKQYKRFPGWRIELARKNREGHPDLEFNILLDFESIPQWCPYRLEHLMENQK